MPIAGSGRAPVMGASTVWRPRPVHHARFRSAASSLRSTQGNKAMHEALSYPDDRIDTGFRSIVESLDDAIVVLSPTGIIEYISPAIERITGRARHDLLGAPLLDCVTAADRAEMAAAVQEATRTGRSAPLNRKSVV